MGGEGLGVVYQREESLGIMTKSSLETQESMPLVRMSETPFSPGLLLASEIFHTIPMFLRDLLLGCGLTESRSVGFTDTGSRVIDTTQGLLKNE